MLDGVLLRKLVDSALPHELSFAWTRITADQGRGGVEALAARIGQELPILTISYKTTSSSSRILTQLTVGIVEMSRDAPHGGELHPDGDEFVCVLSGSVSVTIDSAPEPMTLRAGEGCLIPQGEWHRVHLLEPTRLLHITPGPHGAHRPVQAPTAGAR
ncbi:MAG: cupin domain-containing protein [Steroidobacteraceae bacterium]